MVVVWTHAMGSMTPNGILSITDAFLETFALWEGGWHLRDFHIPLPRANCGGEERQDSRLWG